MSDCTRKAGTTKKAKMNRPKKRSPSNPNKINGTLKLNLRKMVKSKKKEERALTKMLSRRTHRKKIRNITLKKKKKLSRTLKRRTHLYSKLNKSKKFLINSLTSRRMSMMLCHTKVKEQEKSKIYLKMLTNQRTICHATM